MSGLEDEIRRGILASMVGKSVTGRKSGLDLNTPHRYTQRWLLPLLTKGEKTMQGLKGVIAAVMLVAAAVTLGGCFGHHEKAVVMEPLKLG